MRVRVEGRGLTTLTLDVASQDCLSNPQFKDQAYRLVGSNLPSPIYEQHTYKSPNVPSPRGESHDNQRSERYEIICREQGTLVLK